MNLIFNYDSSTSTAPPEFKATLNEIAAYLDAAIPSAATISINVTLDARAGFLGTSNETLWVPESYAQLQTVIPGLPTIDPHPGTQYQLSYAQTLLLGLADPRAPVGTVDFSSTYPFHYDHSNDTSTYDFIGVALHEITEVLGRVSIFNPDATSIATEFDIFRSYVGSDAFFNLNGHNLDQFATHGEGTDNWDWASSDNAYSAASGTGLLHFTEVDQLVIDSLFGTHRTHETFDNQVGSIAVTVENEMYGVVGTQAEVDLLVHQFLPSQIAFAQQFGLSPIAVGTEAVGLNLAFGNENGNQSFAEKYGPTIITDGHQFASLVAHNVFGSAENAGSADVVFQWLSHWESAFATNGIPGIDHPNASQIELGARGAAFGDAVGVALDNNLINTHDIATNFIGLASHGTGVYGAPLAIQPEYNPLLMV